MDEFVPPGTAAGLKAIVMVVGPPLAARLTVPEKDPPRLTETDAVPEVSLATLRLVGATAIVSVAASLLHAEIDTAAAPRVSPASSRARRRVGTRSRMVFSGRNWRSLVVAESATAEWSPP
jgi:hypothetical protein